MNTLPLSSLPLQSTALSKELAELNARLPKGITASISFVKLTVFLSFTVKFMHEGERVNLGSFTTYTGAVDAMFNYKRKKAIILSQEEIDGRLERMRELASINMAASLKSNSHAIEEEQQNSKKGYDAELMQDVFAGVSALKFDCGKPFDFFWDKENKMYSITPRMVKQFYESMNNPNKELEASTIKGQEIMDYLEQQTEFSQAQKKEQEQGQATSSELSDEEYDKLLGLD